MFPGQGSLYPSMISKLVGLHPPNGELLTAASDHLHRDLAAHYREDNEEIFGCNRHIQIGVFLANCMFLEILNSHGIQADLSLGLSLGEYNHLLHIGALGFEETVETVEQRGHAYDAGPAGAMASVFPIELEELEEVVEKASASGVLEIVNLNSPGQHVLSGEKPAIEEAVRILDESSYAQTVVIEDNIPVHCSTFEPVGREFRKHLETLTFVPPRLPYFPNRLGHPLQNATQEDFVELLSTHVHRPVLWRHSIDLIVEQWPDAVFVEVGPRKVLSNLLHRRWHPVRRFHTDSEKGTHSHLESLIGTLEALKHPTEEAPEHVL
ncbi:ACP S-malonyltransferase [Gemmatimonadota bacterium]